MPRKGLSPIVYLFPMIIPYKTPKVWQDMAHFGFYRVEEYPLNTNKKIKKGTFSYTTRTLTLSPHQVLHNGRQKKKRDRNERKKKPNLRLCVKLLI